MANTQPDLHISPTDVVLLVHGTFADRSSDSGDSWWQEGSTTWHELHDHLPENVRVASQHQVFHWSGKNSERARIKAGGRLLERFQEFEEEGVRYHVIGHSHGGSVIWHALRLAELEKLELENLQSWATVGTPFLNHRTRGQWSLVNVANIVFALLLLKPAYITSKRILHAVAAAVLGRDISASPNASDSRIMQIIRAPALKTLELLGVPVKQSGTDVMVGSFDPSSGEVYVQYLFTSPEGLTIVAVALVFVYVLLNLAGFFLEPVLESFRIRAEKRLEKNVAARFGSRWMGIWSNDDEAINGLKATLDLSLSFVAKMVPRERVLVSDVLAILSRPYYWVLSPVFNRFVRPALDNMIRSYIVKTVQGNNRPAAEVVQVSSVPAAIEPREAFPSLPAWLNDRIVEQANLHTGDIAPKLRKLISSTCIMTGLGAFGHELSGRELVHTSYFDHPEIIDLLAMHISWANHDLPHFLHVTDGDQRLVEWYRQIRAATNNPITQADLQAAERLSRPALIHPRRRPSNSSRLAG